MRTFNTGATRDSDDYKHDYEGYLSPLAIERFGEYMTLHRKQADGSLRASDNWQKGIPFEAYMKSMWRHLMDVWKLHRGIQAFDYKTGLPVTIEDALCGVLFNAQGYLHETVRERLEEQKMIEEYQEDDWCPEGTCDLCDSARALKNPEPGPGSQEMPILCAPGTCIACDSIRARL